MEGFLLQENGVLQFLGTHVLPEEITLFARRAFGDPAHGVIERQLQALFMAHFLDCIPRTWFPKCGAIVHGNTWVAGPRVADTWFGALELISSLGRKKNGDADADLDFDEFPEFWFCCTKEDKPQGFKELLSKKTIFSDFHANEELLLKFFNSVFYTRLCPLVYPKNLIHLTETDIYSLKTFKAHN